MDADHDAPRGEGQSEDAAVDTKGLTRKTLLAGGAAAGAAIGLGGAGAAFGGTKAPATAKNGGDGDYRDGIAFINGKIHTMDATNSVVSGMVVENGVITQVGNDLKRGNVKTVNLRGRTVIPGLIEGHIHIVSVANRPGYHVNIENATNIAEIQEILAARRVGVPDGQFVTSMGGWHPNLFAEHRLPTLDELDAAVPDRPVFLYQQGGGPARTNTLGKAFFESASDALAGPVTVGADGSIATGNPNMANRALYHLRTHQTFEDKVRGAVDAQKYSAQVGLTASLDQVLPPSNGPIVPTQGLPNLDQFQMYDGWREAHLRGLSLVRLQTNFLHNSSDPALPDLHDRLKNSFELHGDDMMMTGAIGEWPAPGDGTGAVWLDANRLVAQYGWRNTNRNLSLAALQNELAGYELLASEGYDLAGMRWTLHHLNVCTQAELDRAKALGIGVQAGAWRFVTGTGTTAGAPFRLIVDSGVKAGIHQDGVHIACMNPWFAIYYATTGMNALGANVNVGQSITRQEALRLFTRENAWHLSMEDKIGSLEVGKLGDAVVLDKDYLTVTDEELKRIKPLLTTVGGRVVWDAGAL